MWPHDQRPKHSLKTSAIFCQKTLYAAFKSTQQRCFLQKTYFVMQKHCKNIYFKGENLQKRVVRCARPLLIAKTMTKKWKIQITFFRRKIGFCRKMIGLLKSYFTFFGGHIRFSFKNPKNSTDNFLQSHAGKSDVILFHYKSIFRTPSKRME